MVRVFVNNILFHGNDDKVLLINEKGTCSFLDRDINFSLENFKDILSEDNGFSVIILHSDKVFFAVDRIRTYPLFYASEGDQLFISDDASWIKDNLQNNVLNEYAVIEFYQSGFVTGNQTLYKNIFTLQAGECAYAIKHNRKWKIENKKYFEYYTEKRHQSPEHELYDELDGILHKTFSNIVEKNRDRTLVVPLSGGLDSRLIVYWLKRLGCKNVLCYSFGTPANKDCKKAQEVASKLQYKWEYVNLTNQLWKEAYKSSLYKELKKHYSGYCSIMSSQEFPAVYQMVKNNILPEKSVIIPAHTGDFISGGHIPRTIYDYEMKLESAVGYIFQKHFMLWKTINFNYRKRDCNYLKERIMSQIDKYKVDSHEDIAKIIELYDWQERQAKFIIQFINVYKLFGFPFELPLWSNDLIQFFIKIPLDLKYGKKLYINYCQKFDKFGIFQDIKVNGHYKNENNKSKRLLKEIIGKAYQIIYIDSIYKVFLSYFKDDLNYYAPFFYPRIVLGFTNYRNPNSFFVQDYLKEIKLGQL